MPTTSHPDLLPFAQPSRIGLAFHGLVTNGQLGLPGSGTKSHPQPEGDGSTWVASNQEKANTRERTPEEQASDTVSGKTWLPYAIISGNNRTIGGQSLESGPPHHHMYDWLYADPAGTVWQVGVERSGGDDGTITYRVVLRRRFGYFSADPDKSWLVQKTIGTHDHVVVIPAKLADQVGDVTEAEIAARIDTKRSSGVSYGRDLDHLEDGSEAILNITLHDSPAPFQPSAGLIGWLYISISGTGSLEAESLGDGINAVMTDQGLDAVYSIWTTDDSYEPDHTGVGYNFVGISSPTAPSETHTCPIPVDPLFVAGGAGVYEIQLELDGDPVSWEIIRLQQRAAMYQFVTGDKVIYEKKNVVSYEYTRSVSGNAKQTWDATESCSGPGQSSWDISPDCDSYENSLATTAEVNYVLASTIFTFSIGNMECKVSYTDTGAETFTKTKITNEIISYANAYGCSLPYEQEDTETYQRIKRYEVSPLGIDFTLSSGVTYAQPNLDVVRLANRVYRLGIKVGGETEEQVEKAILISLDQWKEIGLDEGEYATQEPITLDIAFANQPVCYV